MNEALKSLFDALFILVTFLVIGIGTLYLLISGFIWLWSINQILAIAALLFLILVVG